jgi:hypothetical protein
VRFAFEALKTGTVKVLVFWDVMLFSVVEVYRCFGRTCCLHLQIKKRIGFLDSKFCESANTGNSNLPAEDNYLRIVVLAAVTIKTAHFWDVTHIVR